MDYRAPQYAAPDTLAVDHSSASMSTEQAIRFLCQDWSIETTPNQARKVENFNTLLPAGTRVMITHLAGQPMSDTVDTAIRLANEGFRPVPHLAARNITSAQELDNALARLSQEAGVSEALALGGGADTPAGPFNDTMSMLRSGLFQRHHINRIGVAGHPEGSPDIDPALVRQAILDKNAYAEETGTEMYIITQFCFETAPILAWDQSLKSLGNKLPVMIGLPGLATIKTLLNHAKMCGVGASMRVLTRQAANLTKLMSVRQPTKLLAGLANARIADPTFSVQGVHVFPLGGLKKSCAWMYAVTEGHTELAKGSDDFKVTVDLETLI